MLPGRARRRSTSGTRARELPVVRAPRNHEHGLDVEDDEQHRDHVELDGEALARVAERRNAGFVRRLLDRGRARAKREVGEPEHQHRVRDDEAEQEQDREVRATHESPNFVKSFTKSQRGKLSRAAWSVNGRARDARCRAHACIARDTARFRQLLATRSRRPPPPTTPSTAHVHQVRPLDHAEWRTSTG